MSKRSDTRRWLDKHRNDPYVRAAQKDNYRSRAVYKLAEVDERVAGPADEVLSSHADDPESRRRAAIQIGLWHREPADLSIVLSALRSDRDVNVRAGCAYALELAMRRDAAVVNALASVLGDEREDMLVRDNAWHAISALGPLPENLRELWQSWKDQRDARSEGGAG